jgi:phosphoenolpyruvate synthase/pyruvate phosphate dikinase
VVGGKAANFGELRDIDGITVPDGLVVPVHYYRQFLEQNGFDAEIAAMLADPAFQADGNVRRQRLAALQEVMRAAPVDADLVAALEARLVAAFPGTRMRFRSSTNAEDLDGFTGAGLYDSVGGAVGDPDSPPVQALREVWASLWNARAFEERAYASIAHTDVAMAILVHPAYTDESANGVAITANLFDPAPGGEDAFYINAQLGETSVVQPPASGIVADQLLYYFQYANQPATYYAHSNLVPAGQGVLSRRELFALGQALDAIRDHFRALYDPPDGYGQLPMDVEWKRVGTGEASRIEIKQARPYPGRGH